MIRHLVALRFKEGTSDEVKQEIFTNLAGLKGHIEGILDFQTRMNVSVEDHVVRGFRDLFWFDFRDTDIRDNYLQDTQHQAIGARLVAACEGGIDGVFVMDFAA